MCPDVWLPLLSSYLLSKGETWERNIEGSALWVQHLPPFTAFWPTSFLSPNGWILSSMTDTVETGDSLLLFPCFTTSSPTPSWRCTDCIAQRPGRASGHTCQEQAHGASEDYTDGESFLVSLLLHTGQKLSSQSIHFCSPPLPHFTMAC